MTSKSTCGQFYKAALSMFAPDEESVRIFAAGFMCGQAEKVYLGACRAAMFRPSDDRREMVLAAVKQIADLYGLVVIEPIGSQREIWICSRRSLNENDVRLLEKMEENTEAWHSHRAYLCGIPANEIDYEFHLRQGHGERCD